VRLPVSYFVQLSGESAVCPARNVRPSSSASAINYPHGPLVNFFKLTLYIIPLNHF